MIYLIYMFGSALVVLLFLVLLMLLWRSLRRRRNARRGKYFDPSGDPFEGQPDMSAGIFSVPTLDDAAGIAAVARDQAEFHHEQERAVELSRRQRRYARWDWLPWSWRMSRLRVQLEESRLATQRERERAEFYRQHVVDHTTPSVRACRAADDAAEGFDHGSDGSDAPITADNQWRD